MKPQISDIQRTRVVELQARGYSDRAVVRLLENDDIFISQHTVNRTWKSIIPSLRPMVDETHRRLRSKSAQARKRWRIERFHQICFTDESKLCQVKAGRARVRLRKGEVLPAKYHRKRVMFHGGLEVMVWGMISYEGDRVRERLDNTLDGPGYWNLLKRCVRWRGLWMKHWVFSTMVLIDTSLQMGRGTYFVEESANQQSWFVFNKKRVVVH